MKCLFCLECDIRTVCFILFCLHIISRSLFVLFYPSTIIVHNYVVQKMFSCIGRLRTIREWNDLMSSDTAKQSEWNLCQICAKHFSIIIFCTNWHDHLIVLWRTVLFYSTMELLLEQCFLSFVQRKLITKPLTIWMIAVGSCCQVLHWWSTAG